MAKPVCEICNDKPAKRKCLLFKGQFICPSCCAGLRNEECGGCRHFQAATRYSDQKAEGKRESGIKIAGGGIYEEVDHALSWAERGKWDKARTILDELERDHPDHPVVLYGLGVLAALEDRMDDAIHYLEKAVTLSPDFAQAYFNLGMAYQRRFDIRKTVFCMRKVIKIGGDPELLQQAQNAIWFLEETARGVSKTSLDTYLLAQEHFERAFSLMENGQWLKAIEGFQKALELHPDHVQSYGNMGICFAQLGQKSKALSHFERALNIDPSYEPAMANKRQIERLMREGKPLDGLPLHSINYYQEYPLKKKSFLDRHGKLRPSEPAGGGPSYSKTR